MIKKSSLRQKRIFVFNVELLKTPGSIHLLFFSISFYTSTSFRRKDMMTMRKGWEMKGDFYVWFFYTLSTWDAVWGWVKQQVW